QALLHVRRLLDPIRPEELHFAAVGRGLPTTSQLANTLVHARCEIASVGRVRAEQLRVGLRAGLRAEQRLYRARQGLGELRFFSFDRGSGERRSGCDAAPIAFANRQLELDREMRQIVAKIAP